MTHDHSGPAPQAPAFWGSRYSLGLLVLGGVGLFFLLSEHRAHVLSALPLLLILACPLMHLFMHQGHGGHGHAHGQRSEGTSPNDGGVS